MQDGSLEVARVSLTSGSCKDMWKDEDEGLWSVAAKLKEIFLDFNWFGLKL